MAFAVLSLATGSGTTTVGLAIVVALARPPDGVEHHCAPLGVVSVSESGLVATVGDCRKQFGPMAS